MKNMKNLFESPKSAVLSTLGIIAVIGLVGAGAMAASKGAGAAPPVKETASEISADVMPKAAVLSGTPADTPGTTADASSPAADTSNPAVEAAVTVEKAKSIALTHAGFSEAQVTYSKAKLENDDGRTVYEVDFYLDGMEYDYEIDADSGEILEYDAELDD